ncbi:tetratricopeptide repeat protein [Labilithrix luteola]|nr:hypothetical protein [Labilithrix luteola]
MSLRRWASVGACALAVFEASPAWAQSTRDAASAEALFKLGRDALDTGNFEEACVRLHESYRLDPAGGTLLNIGVCEEGRGHLAAAWEAFSEALAHLPHDDKRRARAEERIAVLDRRLARLTIVLAPTAPAGTRVVRDAIALESPSLGIALPVDPGVHHVRVVANGHDERTVDVTLAEGEQRHVTVEPGPPSPLRPTDALPAKRDAETTSGFVRTFPAAAWIAGGALVVAGATFGGLTYASGRRVEDQCNASGTCSPAGLDAVDDARRWGALSTAAFVTAGVAVTAGLVVRFLVHPNQPKQTE